MRLLKFALVLAAALAATTAWAEIDARMLRFPAVSKTKIAFSYAGDIWVVAKSGGVAERLSTPKGEEAFPRFSPDGSVIAYSANYDGNTDIYVIPAAGGVPVRVTHHPAPEIVVDWYPDGGSILFASGMVSGRDRFNRFFKVSRAGGLPEPLPLPYAEFGSLSPDGKMLAYVPISTDFRTWKRYRGGMAPDIWLFDLANYTWENITNNPASDSIPMWHGRTIYFLSDRGEHERANIWAYNLDTKATRQVTFFKDYDIHFPSIGPQEIVLQNGGQLYLLDLATEKLREVKVEVVTDEATLKPRMVGASKLIQSASLSPSGKRVIFEARGDLFSAPAEHGPVFNLTRTSGVAERFPALSPDGKSVAYFSDRSGDYELTIRPADGSGEERQATKLGPGFRYHIFWSPDSKKVAFVDQAMRINLCDVESGKVTVIDKGLDLFQGDLDGFVVRWSADSRWATYARNVENQNSVVFLYDIQSAKLHQVTGAFYASFTPVFDPDGKYLYVLTNRTFKPVYSDLDNSWIYPNSTNVAAFTLRRDVASPLAARDDKDGAEKKDEKKDDKSKADKPKEESKKEEGKKDEEKKEEKEKPKPVDIDIEGFEQRLVILPPAAGNYTDLQAVAGKVLYHRRPRAGAEEGQPSPIVYFDLEEREEKTVLGDADGFALSADGKKLLVNKKDDFAIIDIKPDQKMEKKIDVSGFEAFVDPPAEWRQIFNDAWRIERDFFYDPGMHGVNWNEMKERYGKLLDFAVTRWDLNFLIGELIAELNSSHTYRGGGDVEEPQRQQVGLLGCDFALENGAYRIKKIIAAAPWETEERSPLSAPGVDVKEGDYVLAVNHIPLSTKEDPWAAFQGLAKKTVLLTVNSKPGMEGARDVLVETVADEGRLRNLAWIEEKRLMVDKATGGRVGYIYVPDTGRFGQTELVRQFRAQYDKDGLIIDERFNSGGQIPDRFVELLNRPITNYWRVRDGRDWQWPPVANGGPKVMLINGWSGSGGDCFPFYFKEAGLGPLIGQRTWGGLIGISGTPTLIDGGIVTAPTFGIYSTAGKWIIEGHGVDPDIQVVDDPAKMAKGGDPQLERGIEEVKRLIEQKPPRRPAEPAYPKKAGD